MSLALSADGKTAAVGTVQSQIILWNTEEAEEIDCFEEGNGGYEKIKGVAFSPDGKHLASSWDNGKAVIWDLEEGEIVKILVQDLGYASHMEYSPDGKKLAMAYRQSNGTHGIRIWNTENYEVARDLLGHEGYINGLRFSPDSKVILSGSDDKTARVWQVSNGRRLVTLKGHESGIKAVNFSADGQLIITCSNDYTTRIWGKSYPVKEFKKASSTKIFKKEPTYSKKHSGYVNAVDFSTDNKYLATGSSYYDLKLWEAATGKEVLSVKTENKIIASLKNKETFWREGIEIEVKFILEKAKYLTIPKSAIIYNLEGDPFVYIQRRGNQVRKSETLELGPIKAKLISVKRGLQREDFVITNPQNLPPQAQHHK